MAEELIGYGPFYFDFNKKPKFAPRANKTVHFVQVETEEWARINVGIQPFYLSKNEYDFREGDILIIEECNRKKETTGRRIGAEIMHLFNDRNSPHLKPECMAMGLRILCRDDG